jgi:AraC-like DNA-binding protein
MPEGIEYYNDPSVHAQSLHYYVVSIGKSRPLGASSHGHEHEAKFLLHYVRGGEFWHRLRNRVHRVHRGQIVLMDLRDPVSYGNDRTEPAKVWWVCFGGKEMPQLFAELEADRRAIFDIVNRTRFEAAFNELLNIIKEKPPGYEIRQSGLLLLLLSDLLAAREPEVALDFDLVKLPRQIATISPAVRDSIRYIARHHDQAVTLDLKTLCGISGLSLFHFTRLFRREVGTTPMQYLNRYRIEKAKQALETGIQPIAQVGRMVGIPNQFKFSRLFRKITGQTPSAYRTRALRQQSKQ